ncbi:sensor histidine kinase [Streptomyces sp. Root369]|uniref:sensor histidine kinase n=1 Tax=Streptomyces sp. Root369 TaxID=1736523 RepID=UPI000710EE3D|nr:sensor histidine kinase [Streptomyces sp. Root369]KQV98971.1 histidine kinase [Streptomyces sp. Root369]
MTERPPNDPYPSGTLHLWNTISWVLLGLLPTAVAVLDADEAKKYWSWSLLILIVLCYAVVLTLPRNPVLRPKVFLVLLSLVMGGISYLLGGAAAFYIVSLPHFWILVRGQRPSIALSGLGAATTVFGGTLRQGWSPQFLTGNNVFTVVAYAAGVALGLWLHRFIGQHNARNEQLAAELEHAQRELAEAHQRQGAAAERERIAREIHDTLAQGFASIIVLAEAARSAIPTDAEKCAQQLLSIAQTARENFAEARVLVGSASQSGVAAGSVATTLRRTLDRFAQDTGLTVTTELADVDCDQTTRIALLRCTQESLANVRKHAAATTVGVVLARHPHGIELEITDDGRGFVVDEAHGFGLVGMRKRLAELDGDLSVTSSVGDGTRVLATIPTNSQD